MGLFGITPPSSLETSLYRIRTALKSNASIDTTIPLISICHATYPRSSQRHKARNNCRIFLSAKIRACTFYFSIRKKDMSGV